MQAKAEGSEAENWESAGAGIGEDGALRYCKGAARILEFCFKEGVVVVSLALQRTQTIF